MINVAGLSLMLFMSMLLASFFGGVLLLFSTLLWPVSMTGCFIAGQLGMLVGLSIVAKATTG